MFTPLIPLLSPPSLWHVDSRRHSHSITMHLFTTDLDQFPFQILLVKTRKKASLNITVKTFNKPNEQVHVNSNHTHLINLLNICQEYWNSSVFKFKSPYLSSFKEKLEILFHTFIFFLWTLWDLYLNSQTDKVKALTLPAPCFKQCFSNAPNRTAEEMQNTCIVTNFCVVPLLGHRTSNEADQNSNFLSGLKNTEQLCRHTFKHINFLIICSLMFWLMTNNVFILELDHRTHFDCQILTEAHPCNPKMCLRDLFWLYLWTSVKWQDSAKKMY